MLIHSLRIPLRNEADWEQMMNVYESWLANRRRRALDIRDLYDAQSTEDFDYEDKENNQILRIRHYSDDKRRVAICRLERHEEEATWTTDFLYVEDDKGKQIFTHMSCERHVADNWMPFINKPAIIREIVQSGLCANDGGMPIHELPIPATRENQDLCVSIMRGTLDYVLPVVYVSRYENNSVGVNVKYLAKKLCGLAHVIEEPEFSHPAVLGRCTDWNNTHTGFIGIYFPGTTRVQKYDPAQFPDRDCLNDTLQTDVRLAWLNRSDAIEYTWDAIASMTAHKRIREWQDSNKLNEDELLEFMADFDAENQELRRKNQALAQQLYALQAKQQYSVVPGPDTGDTFFNAGGEAELYRGEKNDLLHSLLSQALTRFADNSRPYHLIRSLLDANPREGECGRILDGVRDTLKNCPRLMDAELKQLADLGFAGSRGEHIKLVFHDPRYCFTIASTPSDSRAYKNSVANICRILDVEKKIM